MLLFQSSHRYKIIVVEQCMHQAFPALRCWVTCRLRELALARQESHRCGNFRFAWSPRKDLLERSCDELRLALDFWRFHDVFPEYSCQSPALGERQLAVGKSEGLLRANTAGSLVAVSGNGDVEQVQKFHPGFAVVRQ